MAQKDNERVIEAAGGLVWKKEPDGDKLLIIRRILHGSEWTLPKGKRKSGEDWQETASREVEEETGCKELRLGSFAGVVTYPVEEGQKIVLFWNMESEGECKFQANEEVKEVKWLAPREALKLLRYPKERALITNASCLVKRNPVILRDLRKIFKSSSHRRLDTEIGPIELELKGLIEARVKENIPSYPWAELSTQMIDCANQALELGEIEMGWRYLLQAELLSVHLVKKENLKVFAQATLDEAQDKLKSSWRLETIENLFVEYGKLKDDAIDANEVYTAVKLLKEHHSNTYIKINTARFQLEILAIMGFIMIPLAVWILPKIGENVDLTKGAIFYSVVILGAMGGVISAFFSVARVRVRGKIPDQLLNSWITISRPLVGAISALGVFLFLLSGLIQLGQITPNLILAVSFAAGFTERIIISAVEKVS